MPVITALKAQKNKKRMNVYVDGQFSFGLDLDTVAKSGIKVGQEYTTETLNEVIKTGEFQKTYDKLMRFASLRPRSEKEIERWFDKNKVHQSIRGEIVEKVVRYIPIDDTQFSMWWIDQRNKFRPRSKKALFAELMQKGVPKNIIKTSLEKADVDEFTQARNLIFKKMYKWERFEKQEKKMKMQTFLSQKGYSWNIISELIGEFVQDTD